MILITYKALHQLDPSYISDLMDRHAPPDPPYSIQESDLGGQGLLLCCPLPLELFSPSPQTFSITHHFLACDSKAPSHHSGVYKR